MPLAISVDFGGIPRTSEDNRKTSLEIVSKLKLKSIVSSLTRTNNVTVCWVPGQEGIPGNERAKNDTLANQGSASNMMGPQPFCGISWCESFKVISKWVYAEHEQKNGTTVAFFFFYGAAYCHALTLRGVLRTPDADHEAYQSMISVVPQTAKSGPPGEIHHLCPNYQRWHTAPLLLQDNQRASVQQFHPAHHTFYRADPLEGCRLCVDASSGYSSSEETRLAHEDTIFVPAGIQFSQKKKETTRRSSKKEVKIPRTYYEIKRDKKKEGNNKSPRHSECRPAERTENEGMLVSHNRELKGNSPPRNDIYNSETKADTTEYKPVLQPKQVTWSSTVCNDGNSSIVSEPQVMKAKAFSLNFRKEGNANNMNEKQVLSLSSNDRKKLMNQEEDSCQLNFSSVKAEDNIMSGSNSTAVSTSLVTSPNTNTAANTSNSSSSSLNVTKSSFVNSSINSASSLSDSDRPYLSSRQKFRMKYSQEMQELAALEVKRKDVQLENTSSGKEMESIVSVSNSCGNLPNPNVISNTSNTSNLSNSSLNSSINSFVNSSINSASSLSDSERPYLSNRQKFRLKYNQEMEEIASLEAKRKGQLDSTSVGKEMESIVSTSNSFDNLPNPNVITNTSNTSNLSTSSLNTSTSNSFDNLPNPNVITNTSNTSNLATSSLIASINSSVNLGISSASSTSDSEQPYMSSRQKFRLKYKQEMQTIALLEATKKSVQFENTLAEKETELVLSVSNSSGNLPNSNITPDTSAIIPCMPNDHNSKIQKETEIGISDIQADSSKGSQSHLSNSRLQNNISGEQKVPEVSSNIISARCERHKRMEAVMSSSGVLPSDEDDLPLVRPNQHLVRLMKSAAGVLVHSKTDQVIPPATILSDIDLDSRIIQVGQDQ
ncbi:hypothetical protein J6590_063925 [Homalodisca vitripennis]|nr:hypothetical protein J6590_063925 [Homalodisca vitripennis]